MTQIYRIVFVLSWVLGLVSILAGAMIKVLHLAATVMVAPHTGFIAACAFFLCALATREMQRAQST